MQDRLDGGISLLIRCPGSEVGSPMSPKKITINLYITPRELQEVPQQIGGDVAVLVQAFSQEFAIPHLQRFAKRCAIEKIKPPKYGKFNRFYSILFRVANIILKLPPLT